MISKELEEEIAKVNTFLVKTVFPSVRELFNGKQLRFPDGRWNNEVLSEMMAYVKLRVNKEGIFNLADIEFMCAPSPEMNGSVLFLALSKEEGEKIRTYMNLPVSMGVKSGSAN